jgi:BlaI family penicillinase repressor
LQTKIFSYICRIIHLIMKHLTNREEEIMDIFWQKEPLYVKEVLDKMPEPKPHYNTISTIVRGLEDKGFLGHEQFGNTHRYSAIISREEFSRNTIKNIVGKYFDKSYSSVVSMFVKEEKISVEEIKELIRLTETSKPKSDE